MTETSSKSWLQRLKAALFRTSSFIADGIGSIFTGGRLSEDQLEELEDLLIGSDVGIETAARLVDAIRKSKLGKDTSADEVKILLAEEIEKCLSPVAQSLAVKSDKSPHIILVVGVNGSGKTTTIGKLAQNYRRQGKKVMLAAGDTFRAAAIEQLKIWGERTKSPVIAKDHGADAAGLAFEAIEQAEAEKMDVLLIDTAGRLHNKSGLMEELAKVVRVIQKRVPDAPHDTILVLDATVGQNAHAQVENFQKMVQVSGLVMTKLDGTAKGGVIVALAEKFGLPVHAIGIGEGAEDLKPFTASDFAKSLVGTIEN